MEKIYNGVIYIIMTVIIIFNAYDRLKKIKENLPMHIIFILCYLFIITMTEIIGYFIQKDKINN